MAKKQAALWVLLLSLPLCWLFSFANEKQFSLPVRVIENTQDPVGLNNGDIRLLVNGNPQQVEHLIRKERSLSGVPDLGRYFILSFHNIKGTKSIEHVISYFVAEILDPKDLILLLSPIKAYRIPVIKDKQKMIEDVIAVLSKDGALHEKNRISEEKNLETELHRLSTIASEQPADFFPEGTRNPEQALAQTTNLSTNYKAINQVLLNFPQNFTRFRNRYLLPDIVKHKEIKNLLEKKHGEKWWIDFQHREDIQIIQKARSAGQKLGAYIATHESGTLARTMQKSLVDFEKQLLISESLPSEEILDTLLGKNICFNVVFWGSLQTAGSNAPYEETSDLEAALGRIAEYSGGKVVVATDPEQGIKEIKNHSDNYYDLIFGYDGTLEEKQIHISANRPNLELSYKKNFSEKEIEEWIQSLAEKTVEISNFALHKNTIHFEIESFDKDREKQFGLLKVRISLFDGDNTNVHKKENILRASEDRVKISITLSPGYRGKFRLVIEVFDLLANISASSEQFIEIDNY